MLRLRWFYHKKCTAPAVKFQVLFELSPTLWHHTADNALRYASLASSVQDSVLDWTRPGWLRGRIVYVRIQSIKKGRNVSPFQGRRGISLSLPRKKEFRFQFQRRRYLRWCAPRWRLGCRYRGGWWLLSLGRSSGSSSYQHSYPPAGHI